MTLINLLMYRKEYAEHHAITVFVCIAFKYLYAAGNTNAFPVLVHRCSSDCCIFSTHLVAQIYQYLPKCTPQSSVHHNKSSFI